MCELSLICHLCFFQHYHSDYSLFASTTNLSHNYQDESIYDTDGCLLYTQTAQSNLSLFNVSCESLILDDTHDQVTTTLKRTKHSSSSIDLSATHMKKIYHRSTMIFDDPIIDTSHGTLQRWQAMDLLHT